MTVLDKAQGASFCIAEFITQKISYLIAENLIPACRIIVKTMLGVKEQIQIIKICTNIW